MGSGAGREENHMGNKLAITKDDCYLFGEGTHYEIYEKLGAHITEVDGKKERILQYGLLMQ